MNWMCLIGISIDRLIGTMINVLPLKRCADTHYTHNCECKQFSTACQQHFYWNYLRITIKDNSIPFAMCVCVYDCCVYLLERWVSIYKLQPHKRQTHHFYFLFRSRCTKTQNMWNGPIHYIHLCFSLDKFFSVVCTYT